MVAVHVAYYVYRGVIVVCGCADSAKDCGDLSPSVDVISEAHELNICPSVDVKCCLVEGEHEQ